MRIAKKIIFVALAILPIYSLLQGLLFSVNGKDNLSVDLVVDMPVVNYTINGDEVDVDTAFTQNITEQPTLIDSFFSSYVDYTASPGFYKLRGLPATVFKFNVWLNDNVGVPICGSTFGTFMLLFYYAFLGLAEMLVDLITFVPRKVSEIFK